MKQRQHNKKIGWKIAVAGFILVVITGMWAIQEGKALRVQWSAQSFQESNERLDNRERGFYHLARFLITEEEEQNNKWSEQISETPAGAEMLLLQINLQNYSSGSVSEIGMEQIRTIFRAYEEKDTDLIVRFLYDWDGKALLTEPQNIEIILGHMEQMGEVMREFHNSIYIVQGVFAGNWGEMNGSRHLKEEAYLKLLKKLHEVTPESIFLAVRTPGHWRAAAGRFEPLDRKEAWQPEQMISRLSLYNDGIMGNEADYGTYGTVEKKNAEAFGERWLREDEIAFQNQLNLYVPNGGEVIKNNVMNELEPAISTLREMHVSYLNADYDMEVLDKWKNTEYRGKENAYSGMSGYDYIERHLGYRYVIRNADVRTKGFLKKKLQVQLEIENVGFSGRYTPCSAALILRGKDGREIYVELPEADVREWKPSDKMRLKTELLLPDAGEYDLYLKISDDKRDKPVWLANQEIGNADGEYLLGGIKISLNKE